MNARTFLRLGVCYRQACIIAFVATVLLSGAAWATDVPNDRVGFKPSTEGKKLLMYRGPSYDYMKNKTEQMEQAAFDGLILGGAMAFQKKIDPKEQDEWAAKMTAVPFKRYSDNFYLCYSYPGKDASAFDWFDDLSWVVENWRIMAASAKKGGFKGICFDSEYYEGLPLFGYARMRGKDTKSFDEYRAQVRKQAAAMMRAVNESYPDITIMFLFGFSGAYNGVPQHPASRQTNYTLVSAFVDGLLAECRPGASVHDMHEQAFSFRVPGSYQRTRAMMKDVLREQSFDPARYDQYHRAGFSFWSDCWTDAGKGRPFNVEQLDLNYYTPEEFTYSLHHALAYSDKYVWMWPGVFNFWQGTVNAVDEKGKPTTKPAPADYIRGLERAHAASLPEPPRNRRPNTFRNTPAAKEGGFADDKTFADLWNTHEFLADLPEQWRFRIDPDEVGLREGWPEQKFDDAQWETIRIREFWENQGHSPYDGQAWYRLSYKPPTLPAGKKVYLAFGAIADEAQVFINGTSLYASRLGENTRHQRFLVDVTESLKPDQDNSIAVRVWNTGWCGGIWKNVKLVTAK